MKLKIVVLLFAITAGVSCKKKYENSTASDYVGNFSSGYYTVRLFIEEV